MRLDVCPKGSRPSQKGQLVQVLSEVLLIALSLPCDVSRAAKRQGMTLLNFLENGDINPRRLHEDASWYARPSPFSTCLVVRHKTVWTHLS